MPIEIWDYFSEAILGTKSSEIRAGFLLEQLEEILFVLV